MSRPFGILIIFCAAIIAGISFSQPVHAQVVEVPRPLRPGERADPEAKTLQEMVAKQQISRRKKEHDEMLKQGEEALRLSQELETTFEQTESFSDQDRQKLQELEKIVSKIREELGGDDDDDNKSDVSADGNENSARSSIGAAFKFLRTSTIKLVDELKKSTRFSISVAAIRASNSVVKFARFLRLKK